MWKWNRKRFWDFLGCIDYRWRSWVPTGIFGPYCLEKLGPDMHTVVRTGVGFVKVSGSNVHHLVKAFPKKLKSRSTYQGKFVRRIFRMRDQGVASSSAVQTWGWVLGRSLRKNLASLKTWEPKEILLGQRGKERRMEGEKLEVQWKSSCSYQGFSVLAFLTSWVG